MQSIAEMTAVAFIYLGLVPLALWTVVELLFLAWGHALHPLVASCPV